MVSSAYRPGRVESSAQKETGFRSGSDRVCRKEVDLSDWNDYDDYDDAGRQSGRFLDGVTIRKRIHPSLG